LTGRADEWLALKVFVLAGRFTDQHEPGFGVADSEDDIRSGFGKTTGSAGQRSVAEFEEGGAG
jgi:hypothetical protein